VNDALDKPARERCEAALDIAKEALRHIERTAANRRIKQFAHHALNKVGVIMTAGKTEPDAIPVYRPRVQEGET
jgi:hypothetical protein